MVEVRWTTQSLVDIQNIAEFIATDSEGMQKSKQKDFLISLKF